MLYFSHVVVNNLMFTQNITKFNTISYLNKYSHFPLSHHQTLLFRNLLLNSPLSLGFLGAGSNEPIQSILCDFLVHFILFDVG